MRIKTPRRDRLSRQRIKERQLNIISKAREFKTTFKILISFSRLTNLITPLWSNHGHKLKTFLK